jgi:hypothetical protein
MANEGHLITSTEETRDWTIMDVFGDESMLMALPLPCIWMVAFLHLVMRTEWLISAVISIGAEGESKFS